MKNFKHIISLAALFCITSLTIAQGPVNNYNNFMRQYYAGREYQIITPTNMINMDWLKGAMNALYYDGYTQDKDIALVLWQNIANVVNYTAAMPANRNNVEQFKTRIWQSLERSIDELRRQQRAAQPSIPNVPPRPSSRPLPSTPTMALTSEGIANGVLGADYASKAREVYGYNYDKATRGGFINLAGALDKEITNINSDTSLSQTQKADELKKVINRMHTALGKYRVRDKQ